MKDIGKYHQKEYGQEPLAIVEIPQVMTLLGTFSDCINGYALMSTIDSGMRLAISKREDNVVRIINVTKQDKKKFLISNIKYRKEDRWANSAKAILFEILLAGKKLSGMNITIKGRGAIGDSSSFSASLYAGLLFAVNEVYELGFTYDEMLKLSFGANRFSPMYQARLRDLITIFVAKPHTLLFFDLESYGYTQIEYPFEKGKELSSLLLCSGLPYSVLTPEMEEFRLEMSKLALDIKESLPKNLKLRDLTEKDLRQGLGINPERRRRQLMYVIEESRLAKQGYEALCQNDYIGFGKLLDTEQKARATKAELTSPEIDWIARRGSDIPSLYGFAQVFVGISGTMLALIDSSLDFSYTMKLDEYERIFGFHAETVPYVPSGNIRRVENEYPAGE